jgi:hypothetical protein
MLSELHSLNLKLYNKQYNKKFVFHLIVAPQLSSGWQHNYPTKTRQAGCTDEQSMYSFVYVSEEKSNNNNHLYKGLDWVKFNYNC